MDMCRDVKSKYPMMLPTPKQFADYMNDLGVRPDDILVIYDAYEVGLHLSPRVAWTCQHFGHKGVHVLNNFVRYVLDDLPVSSGPLPGSLDHVGSATHPPGQPLDEEDVISFQKLFDIVKANRLEWKCQILDARSNDQFTGRNKSSLDAMPSGHMPSAINVPFTSILGPEKTVLLLVDLKELFTKVEVRENIPTIVSCNSGVTAAALSWALDASGMQVETKLYDGSWSEWAGKVDGDMIVMG